MKQRFLAFFVAIAVSAGISTAQNTEASLSIYHTELRFDFRGNPSQLSGHATLHFEAIQNDVNHLLLDLLELTVDSIFHGHNQLLFAHNDTILGITLDDTLDLGDTLLIDIFYHGVPHREASNFGGFFFTPRHAYNIGVAFREHPHNFGRVWYPCYDSFTSRSTYDLEILMSGGKRSSGPGLLVVDSVIIGDTILQRWHVSNSIPSYLMSMVVADYETIAWNKTGLNRTYPVNLFCLPEDTADTRASFANLDSAIDIFEYSYLPYAWEKVGYSMVPMGGGAMEHATNIAYPLNEVHGDLDHEDLMAHELAHSWWGNLVTCDKQEEMWLNEGWASFSEYLFYEKKYGWSRALEHLKEVHYDVIRHLHHDEGGYRDLVSIPPDLTYGGHVYNKGSLIPLAMREFMGEQAFYDAINEFMDNNRFTDINSAYLRDELTNYSGMDMEPFFRNWVFEPGFVAVIIDSFRLELTPTLNVAHLKISQLTKGREDYYDEVPLVITLIDENGVMEDHEVILNHPSDSFSLMTPYSPVCAVINRLERMPMAITVDEHIVDTTGNVSQEYADLGFIVIKLSDPLPYCRMEEVWAQPPISAGNAAALGVRINPDRFWSFKGVSVDTFEAGAVIFYNGSPFSRLDVSLDSISESDYKLLYRPFGQEKWVEHHNYDQDTLGSSDDTFGRFIINEFDFGDYAIGVYDPAAGIEIKSNASETKIFPNPSGIAATIKSEVPLLDIVASDILGKNVPISWNEIDNGTYRIKLNNPAPGVYNLETVTTNGKRWLKWVIEDR